MQMRYIPRLSAKEIEENHKHFTKRLSIYKKKGLDFIERRRFMLKKADMQPLYWLRQVIILCL